MSTPLTLPRPTMTPTLRKPAFSVRPPPKHLNISKTPTKEPKTELDRDIFKSFRGRSPWDADDDEFEDRHYTIADSFVDEQCSGLQEIPPPSQGRSRGHSLQCPRSRTATLVPSKSSRLTSQRTIRQDLRTRDASFEHKIYDSVKGRKKVVGVQNTPSSCAKSSRRVSWADEAFDANAQQPLPNGDATIKAEQLFSYQFSGRHPVAAAPDFSIAAQHLRNPESSYLTIRKTQGTKLLSELETSKLSTAPDLNLVKGGNMWDPDDDELAEMDAIRVAATFKASYRVPASASPQELGTSSRFGSTLASTFSSLLSLSPSKTSSTIRMSGEEHMRDQLDVLSNTYYCNPDGDLCDETMQQVHLSGSRYFRPHPSPRAMHVIALKAYFETDDPLLQQSRPCLCDAIATLLSHTNSACLAAFLDPTLEEFTWKRELDRNKAGLILLVRRTGNQIITGSYRNFGFSLQWTLYVKSKISATGLWHEVYATLKPGHTKIVNGVPQWDDFVPSDAANQLGDQTRSQSTNDMTQMSRKIEPSSLKKLPIGDDLEAKDPKYALFQSRLLAQYLLQDYWVRVTAFCECRVMWEADGRVEVARLKRALIGSEDDSDGDD